MLKLEKEVRLKYGGGKGRGYVSVVREHYLRDDISCKRDGCCLCHEMGSPSGLLSASATHYLIPDTSALENYLDVIEHPSLSNLILLQTAINHVCCRFSESGKNLRGSVSRQAYSRAIKVLNSSHKHCVVFSNEHHVESFALRAEGETEGQWKERLVYMAGVWYARHLQAAQGSIPVVIATQYPEHYTRLATGTSVEGVLIMSVADYLACFYPEAKEVHALCESLEAVLISNTQEAGGEGGKYAEHLTHQQIAEGLLKNELVSGMLRVSRYKPREEAFVTVHSPPESTIHTDMHVLIHGAVNRNRALHWDLVAVRVLPETATPLEGGGREGRCGVVVGVIERETRDYVASFAEAAENVRGKTERVLVYPYDSRIPKVRIATRQAEQLKNHRIVIRIDSWDATSQYPNGHFVHSIGPIGDLDTETSVILVENRLTWAPFSTAQLNELPANTVEDPWRVSEEEMGKRRDLRHTHLVFSIDPIGCEDVDDTLSVRHLKNGVTELAVHIADVSYFVSPGSLTDLEARDRSTTIYLADRRYDMLPHILSADLCSLLSNVDRYAVSVMWRLDRHYQVKSVWYGRTLIRSRYKLSYEVAQSLYDGASAEDVVGDIPELVSCPEMGSKVNELRGAIKSLVEIARVLRSRRAQGGAVELESVEVRVQFSKPSDEGGPTIQDLVPKKPMEMHEIIAECMIFANHWVAKKIYESSPSSALLRRHPSPSQDMFGSLKACCAVKGFHLSTGSNWQLAQSLDTCTDPSDPQVNKILRILATQAMTPAAYFSTGALPPDQFSHYGLALELYTHFTSPIRRYADLVVHRQLLAAVGDGDDVLSLPTNTQLAALADHMNKRHRSAQLAQDASTELFQLLYFKGEGGALRSEVTGVIYALRIHGVMVLVPRYGIRGPLYLRDRNGQVAQPSTDGSVTFGPGSLESSDSAVTVTHPGGQYCLRLFDHVRVRVGVEQSHAHSHSFSLHLLSCHPVDPPQGGGAGAGKKEVVERVKAEVKEREELERTSTHGGVYGQSSPSDSLYCLLQHLQKLSLMEN